MKELSIEEKAKAYDEALKQIKECTPDENGFITIYPQEIFPELKESEDERIRKEIISYIKNSTVCIDTDTFKEWIAWLEKQGNKDEEILVLKDQIESLHAAIKAIKETHRIELEKQGEQKPVFEMKSAEESLGIDSETYSKIVDECIYGEQNPVDKVKPKFKAGDRVIGVISNMPYFITEVCDDYYNTESGCIIMFCAQDNFELYEQKPAWSEEDEMHIRELESFVKQVWAIAEHENDKDTIHKMSDLSFFLKTLKPQPKQELSEGDKRIIDNLISQLGNLYARKLIKEETKDKYVNLLKSIKERCTWKPSDEQMEAINTAINAFGKGTLTGKYLKELYEQLKKLKG